MKYTSPLIAGIALWVAGLLPGAVEAADYQIQHLEPLSWWVGMKEPRVQLMVHGPAIATLTPQVDYPGVRLAGVTRVANKNYLFIDLEIGADTRPGTLRLRFYDGDQLQLGHDYPLLAREQGSATRRGFDASDVIYLITPDRFVNGDPGNDRVDGLSEGPDRANPGGRHGGDIQGMLNSLDYIQAMGYTAIWPNPLVENNQAAYSYHGYSTTDHYRIDPRFGSNADFKHFVSEARARGIGVIQDVILNHIGSGHWWLADLPTPDWLNGKVSGEAGFDFTNHSRTTVQDPYAAREDRSRFVDGWFVDTMPDLNQRNALVATYLIQNSIWWVEYAGLAGIREDTYSYADKQFLSDWSRRLMAEYPHFNIVGEEWSGNPLVVSYWQRGKANADGYVSHLPSLMDFPLHEAMIDGLREDEGWDSGLTRMYEMLASDGVYADPFNLVLFEGNHDTPRLFSQLNEDMALYKMALAYVLTMRGIPQVFYGTEILMTSPKQRDDGIVRSDFPGGWPGDASNAFTGEGLTPHQREAQAYLKQLLNWRKDTPVIHQGKLKHYAPKDGVYSYFRYLGPRKVMVIFNKNDQKAFLDTGGMSEMIAGPVRAKDVITGDSHMLGGELSLLPRSVMVLELAPSQ